MTVNLLLLKANFLWLSVWTSYWITKPEGGRAKWLSILVKKVNCGAGSLTSLVGVWAKVKTLFNLPCKAPFFFLLKLLFFFSSPSSITHFSCTRRHFQKVLSPRPRVKHKEKKKKLNFEDFHLSSEELFLILTSKRMKVATEDTKAVSVESQDLRVLNQDGYAAHFWSFAIFVNFLKLPLLDLEKYQSVAKTHRFSALVSSCWGSDYTVTYNLLVSLLPRPQNAS